MSRLVRLVLVLTAALGAADIPPTGKPVHLFDGSGLHQFDTFVFGQGFNKDPDGVFRVDDGMVRVEGIPYGYFITKQEFDDFYLRAEFKWGEGTHGNRRGLARDSGILYRASDVVKRAEAAKTQGAIWPVALEFQIMEGATGDVILLGGSEMTVKGVRKGVKRGIQIDRFNKTDIGMTDSGWPQGYREPAGFRDPNNPVEKAHGEWNVLEMVAHGDTVKYWVNDIFVMEGTKASETRGKILFQSEGSELYFRNIEVRPLLEQLSDVSRTPWGAPDLRGIWDFRTLTPLERPPNLAGRETLTEAEAADAEARAAQSRVERDSDAVPEQCVGSANFVDCVGSYNQLWFDRGNDVTDDRRTSLIVDPPDGRIPPLTVKAKKRAAEIAKIRARPAHGPEDRRVGARCIVGFNSGPPMSPSAYNNNMQLFQTPDYVAILNEMVHDVRIIPLDRRDHLPTHIRQWMGDSRGHWEGDTLVIDTVNLRPETMFKGSGENMYVIERISCIDADTLRYEYTIDDPESFTSSWTAVFPMRKSEGPIFEYACHEGNYGMYNILSGARAEERASAEAAARK